MDSTPVTLGGPDRIRLVLALNRAHIQPFGHMEWGAFAGAVGDAHTVRFIPEDAAYFFKALAITHWDPQTTLVVLDEGGVTWNGCPPANAYAYQVQVSMDVGIHDPGSPEEYWRVEFKGVPDWYHQLAALPPEAREIALACPEEARPHFIRGWLQEQGVATARDRMADSAAAYGEASPDFPLDGRAAAWVMPEQRARSELEHPWPDGWAVRPA